MNHSPNDRQSPWAPLPGQPARRLYTREAEDVCIRHRRVLVLPALKGFMQISLHTK